MPASGHQNHTTSPSASVLFVKSTNRVHRIPSRVRDDREPPLFETRPRGYNFDLGQIGNGMVFEMGLDSATHVDLHGEIRLCAQSDVVGRIRRSRNPPPKQGGGLSFPESTVL